MPSELQPQINTRMATLPRFISPRCEEMYTPSTTRTRGSATTTTETLQLTRPLQDHKDRWQHMSELAGPHKQDDLTLKFDRPIAPMAFKSGVPSQVAARIETLHIATQSNLPEWLDVLSSTCFALQHLYLHLVPPLSPVHSHDRHDSGSPISHEAARMQRLYILYRLPDLKSIDGDEVTDLERQLARPDTPNGERVNPREWLCDDDPLLPHDDSQDDADDRLGDVVEVSLYGVVKRVAADPPHESFEEPEWDLPYQPQEQRNAYRGKERKSREVDATTQTPALLPSEVSEDEASGEPATPTGYLARFSPLNTLCTRSEKYLPMEDHSFEIENPHRQKPYLDLGQTSAQPRSLFQQSDEPSRQEAAPLDGWHPSHKSTQLGADFRKNSPERHILINKSSCKTTPPRIFLTAAPMSPCPPVLLGACGDSPILSPSRSLTSPFPMQFRLRNPCSRINVPTSGNLRQAPDESRGTIDTTTTTHSPRVVATSQPLDPRPKKPFRRKDDRPPPCPGRVAPVVVMAAATESQHDKRRKRVVGRWRDRSHIRSTPMLDYDSDDDDDTEDEPHTV